MRHTVVGVFDTYSAALGAERALVDAGFVRTDIVIYADEASSRGPGDAMDASADAAMPGGSGVAYPGAGLDASTSGFPTETLENGTPAAPGDETYAARARHAPSSGGAGELRSASEPRPAGAREDGVWGRIEHFFADLFGGGERPPEVAHYAEALRRGAAMVRLDVEYEAQVALAREVMVRNGAIDIDARASQWRGSGQGFERSDTVTASDDTLGAAALRGFPPIPGARSQPVEPATPTNRSHSFADELGVTDPVSGRSRLDQPLGAPAVGTHAQAPSSDWLGDVPAASTSAPDLPGSSQQADERREPPRELWRGSIGTTAKPPHEPRADTPSVRGPAALSEADIDQATSAGVRSYRRRESSEPLPPSSLSGFPDAAAAGAATAAATAGVSGVSGASAAAPIPATGDESAPPRDATPRFSEPRTKTPPSDDTASYCDDSCADYDRQYANEDPRDDGDKRAHDRYRLGDWDDADEPASEAWDRGFPDNGWERLKAAVRHGWDRFTGHR